MRRYNDLTMINNTELSGLDFSIATCARQLPDEYNNQDISHSVITKSVLKREHYGVGSYFTNRSQYCSYLFLCFTDKLKIYKSGKLVNFIEFASSRCIYYVGHNKGDFIFHTCFFSDGEIVIYYYRFNDQNNDCIDFFTVRKKTKSFKYKRNMRFISERLDNLLCINIDYTNTLHINLSDVIEKGILEVVPFLPDISTRWLHFGYLKHRKVKEQQLSSIDTLFIFNIDSYDNKLNLDVLERQKDGSFDLLNIKSYNIFTTYPSKLLYGSLPKDDIVFCVSRVYTCIFHNHSLFQYKNNWQYTDASKIDFKKCHLQGESLYMSIWLDNGTYYETTLTRDFGSIKQLKWKIAKSHLMGLFDNDHRVTKVFAYTKKMCIFADYFIVKYYSFKSRKVPNHSGVILTAYEKKTYTTFCWINYLPRMIKHNTKPICPVENFKFVIKGGFFNSTSTGFLEKHSFKPYPILKNERLTNFNKNDIIYDIIVTDTGIKPQTIDVNSPSLLKRLTTLHCFTKFGKYLPLEEEPTLISITEIISNSNDRQYFGFIFAPFQMGNDDIPITDLRVKINSYTSTNKEETIIELITFDSINRSQFGKNLRYKDIIAITGFQLKEKDSFGIILHTKTKSYLFNVGFEDAYLESTFSMYNKYINSDFSPIDVQLQFTSNFYPQIIYMNAEGDIYFQYMNNNSIFECHIKSKFREPFKSLRVSENNFMVYYNYKETIFISIATQQYFHIDLAYEPLIMRYSADKINGGKWLHILDTCNVLHSYVMQLESTSTFDTSLTAYKIIKNVPIQMEYIESIDKFIILNQNSQTRHVYLQIYDYQLNLTDSFEIHKLCEHSNFTYVSWNISHYIFLNCVENGKLSIIRIFELNYRGRLKGTRKIVENNNFLVSTISFSKYDKLLYLFGNNMAAYSFKIDHESNYGDITSIKKVQITSNAYDPKMGLPIASYESIEGNRKIRVLYNNGDYMDYKLENNHLNKYQPQNPSLYKRERGPEGFQHLHATTILSSQQKIFTDSLEKSGSFFNYMNKDTNYYTCLLYSDHYVQVINEETQAAIKLHGESYVTEMTDIPSTFLNSICFVTP
ncbi:hypothetical protein TBLA_0D01940 [Henningerozyma blattae CBS 6284]|uniref:Uncharacterized protein n=1 Tax=Henningerozyma blattae (strain ATCC 34711 / CBS 6284 / DSM 70876 / NBRC 10599 / NRRL Y-10934 / UCD 77-7) TaxID=1071380 RepID=I2H2V0_HENB6|nr:hypothetical protein TBLA_0D01940 [Tetrapisispora blattae CBS 6284]CCH60702.1 hypothetical protein TBLA_0D01940 [Tetrapisispora blattae CBS 6284]